VTEKLSQAELRIVRAILDGHVSGRAVAEALGLSERTVRTHLHGIYQKLNIHSRTQLVLMALQEGWFAPSVVSSHVTEGSEIRQRMEVHLVDLLCPKCGQGLMRPTGVALMSDPPQYTHQCTWCQHRQNYQRCYPYEERQVV
jgi:DNA-binding CsgD family transcriptional regulator